MEMFSQKHVTQHGAQVLMSRPRASSTLRRDYGRSGHWADTMHRRVGAQGRIGRCEGGDYY